MYIYTYESGTMDPVPLGLKNNKIKTIQLKLTTPVYRELIKKKGKRTWDQFILSIISER